MICNKKILRSENPTKVFQGKPHQTLAFQPCHTLLCGRHFLSLVSYASPVGPKSSEKILSRHGLCCPLQYLFCCPSPILPSFCAQSLPLESHTPNFQPCWPLGQICPLSSLLPHRLVQCVVPELACFVTGCHQRHKKSKLSGWQNFTRKNFQTECVNRFRDIYAAKVRKSLSRHLCAKVR